VRISGSKVWVALLGDVINSKHRRTIGGVPPMHRISYSLEKVQRILEKVLSGAKLVERVLLISF
jgi:hypothetical protein